MSSVEESFTRALLFRNIYMGLSEVILNELFFSKKIGYERI